MRSAVSISPIAREWEWRRAKSGKRCCACGVRIPPGQAYALFDPWSWFCRDCALQVPAR